MDTKQGGYTLAMAIMVLLLFAIIGLAMVNLYISDTKHEVSMVIYDQNYFIAQGALECARHYFAYDASPPYTHDGDPTNDEPNPKINIDGTVMTIEASSVYEGQ